MIQDTAWFWVIVSFAGLLSLLVFFIMIFMNRDTIQLFGFRGFSLALCIGYGLITSGFLWPGGTVSGWLPFVELAYATITLFLCIYLFFNPSVLYGASFSVSNVQEPFMEIPESIQQEEKKIEMEKEIEDVKEIKAKIPSPAPRVGFTMEQSNKYRKLIKEHFADSLAFRKRGYTIRDLSNETGIPGYLVSLFINQEYGMNFNELINACRVDYLAGLVKSSFDYEAYTLEAIGKMAGFNSRTAFIAAIKKNTGMTPSAFFGRKDVEVMEYPIFNFPERMRDVA